MASAFFDLHFHPLFKQNLCLYEEYPTTRTPDDLEADVDLNPILRIGDELLLHIVASQTSIRQMRNGGTMLGAANIVALELGFAASSGLFGSILNGSLSRPLDRTYFTNVRDGKVSYYRLFLHELSLYRLMRREGRIRMLSRKNPAENIETENPCVVLSMEGGHNLCRNLIGTRTRDIADGGYSEPHDPVYDDFVLQSSNDFPLLSAPAESLARLHRALWEEDADLLYLTLTHLTHVSEQLLATHAYGLKMLKHAAFYPQGAGISDDGRDVIKTAYGMSVPGDGEERKSTPILIDIKHMSLVSRQEFYDYRRNLQSKKVAVPPILATHMGVTGYRTDRWKAALERSAVNDLHIKDIEGHEQKVTVAQIVTTHRVAGYWGSLLNNTLSYNPWSINLMDEDILEVLNSGGLIGVSVDERILGYQHKVGLQAKKQPEYLSPDEFRKLFPTSNSGTELLPDERDDDAATESWLVPAPSERQSLMICFNILHILAVAKEHEIIEQAKQHITVGSDFDGLIDPLNNCSNTSLLSGLERDLVRWLPVAEKAYDAEHASGALLPSAGNAARKVEDEPDADAMKQMVRDFLYENGKAFLQAWLKSDFRIANQSQHA